jgi:hypothetical protein
VVSVVQNGEETENLCSLSGYVKKSDSGYAEEARARLLRDDAVVSTVAVSDANGLFTITDVPAGVYTLHIARNAYDDSYVTVEVPAYNNLTYILVQAGNAQNGAVVQKQTVSGVVSREEGGYAEDASIQLYQGSALYGSTATTNVGGAYTLYNVLKGSYSVRIAFEGYNILKTSVSINK